MRAQKYIFFGNLQTLFYKFSVAVLVFGRSFQSQSQSQSQFSVTVPVTVFSPSLSPSFQSSSNVKIFIIYFKTANCKLRLRTYLFPHCKLQTATAYLFIPTLKTANCDCELFIPTLKTANCDCVLIIPTL